MTVVVFSVLALIYMLVAIFLPTTSEVSIRFMSAGVMPVFIVGFITLIFMRKHPKTLLALMLIMGGIIGYMFGYSSNVIIENELGAGRA